MEKIKKVLANPVTLLAAVVLGGLTGLSAGSAARILKPAGDIYMGLLRMCVLPVVVCTITINIGNLFNGSMKGSLRKWILATVLTLLLSAFSGTASGLAFRDYMAPDEKTMTAIANLQKDQSGGGSEFTELSFYGENKGETKDGFSFVDFLVDFVPVNVFAAMAEGNTLQVILFFSVLGIFLSGVEEKYGLPVKKAMEGIYKALCGFISKLLIILPFALYSLVAVQFSREGMQGMLPSLMKLVAVIYVSSFIIIAVSFLLIQKCAGCSLKEHWEAVKPALFISIGTGNCLAALPVSVEGAVSHLHLNRKIVSSVMPIGVTLCQSGIISCGAIAAVYATTIYQVEMNLNTILIIVIGSILFSISIIGVPGIVAVSMLSLILTPLGIPSEVIVLIYLSTVTIFDPICVFASVYSNLAVTAFAAKEKKVPIYETK